MGKSRVLGSQGTGELLYFPLIKVCDSFYVLYHAYLIEATILGQ